MTDELRRRIIYALILIAVVSLCILFLGSSGVFVLALIGGLLAWREYSRLTGIINHSIFYLWGFAWVTLSFSTAHVVGPRSLFWFCVAPLSAFSLLAINRILFVTKIRQISEESPEVSWKLIRDFSFGTIYVFMMLGFVGPIARKTFGQELLFMSMTSVALADTAAYFGGKKWGKNKLWPALSPGKTLEGAYSSVFGALFGSFIVYFIFAVFSDSTMSWTYPLLMGIIAAPLAIQGDLLESLIKRLAGAKDSGTLLPGHGGLLDRLDAFVFVFPFVYFLF